MSSSPISTPFQIGIVSYLNVQPLIYHLIWQPERVVIRSEIPRQLAESLFRGEYDAAIVPVFEALRHPGSYRYIPGSAIAADSPVNSVMVYSQCPLEGVRTVYLDSSSLTSINLFKVLAAEAGLNITYRPVEHHPVPRPLPEGTAWVVIGDPAIAELGQHPYTFDLAQLWIEKTGFPFVFAAWLVPRSRNPQGLGRLLRESHAWGMNHLEEIAGKTAKQFGATPEFAFTYFSKHLSYNLGERELEGWRLFAELCAKHGLIESRPDILPFTD